MKKISAALLSMFSLVACNSGGGSSSVFPPPPTPINLVGPNGLYKCLPDLSSVNSINSNLKIAYGNNCLVENTSNLSLRDSLESMAVAITLSNGRSYCTGTPLSYNENTGVGYILSAAHCFVAGSAKAPNQEVVPSTITTFTKTDGVLHINYINQTLNANGESGTTTGKITAVYIPKRYCQVPYMTRSEGCSDLTQQDGDIALLKVSLDKGQSLRYNPLVKPATQGLSIPFADYIIALGYGDINSSNGTITNKRLYYITYQYFNQNSYQGQFGKSVIFNGYFLNNRYYSIICRGDSGGGDFYWDGTHWNLVGIHSYGLKASCGMNNVAYSWAYDASTDVRPFTTYLQNIMNTDTAAGGCNNGVAANNKFICADSSTELN